MIRSALIVGLVLTVGCLLPDTGMARDDSAARLRSLQSHAKLDIADVALKAVAEEADTLLKVIVNLRDPEARYATATRAGRPFFRMIARPVRAMDRATVRRQLRGAVRAAQDRVTAAVPLTIGRVTHRFDYIYAFAAEATAAELEALAGHADVLSIEADLLLEPYLAQGLSLMQAAALSEQHNGTGVAIAICDTGIDYTHPMLGNGAFPNARVIGGYDTGEDDPDPMDGHGHGTACAGIAAGSPGNEGDYVGGVAYGAKLYALKITYSPTAGGAFVSDMVEAWEWCVTHQYDDPDNPILIISTSFGGDRFSDRTGCDGAVSAMAMAAANAKAAGITIFASAGNEGYCNSIAWPACLSDVISIGAVYDAAAGDYLPCVAAASCAQKIATDLCPSGYYAVDRTAPDAVASYSNAAPFLGLLAPGNAVTTTDIGGGYTDYAGGFSGTSAACPYAAGAAAALQSAAKALTGAFLSPNQIKTYLKKNGDPVTDAKSGITTPRINVGRTVDAITASLQTAVGE